ncbi:Hda3p KNAG_0F03900 [Huiozyma naganishii CBS 8797]|uniref:HDA1 complex subunit 3 n=1 Tax=Huiozyma naganishii (strain ATCC MYA-139 / BCRC 22969 / CBS 8797 / KCTC 17520 / NBRC 10181 / NCYC 3082 / Yp74L-3) TaxID=1071383 RepID=J7S7M8_HUIN7|nr:hypothetical protein KNAG_0F03900 [Kazachstania naganishii CBS 8797]CCK71054.1 hypothetical protein KNAG_0F03900 [Kazachstania naganishii CBS 8797]
MDLLRILDTRPVPSIVDATILGVSGNVSGDYWLPTTMCTYQRELTDQIVSLHYSDILRYFETKNYKEDVVLGSMETMCRNNELVATHPYLLIDHFLPKSLVTRDVPSYLAETSGKFQVLRDLVALVQEYETDTAVVCRPGRTMDLVEALLLGSNVNVKRYDGQTIKSKLKKQKKSYSCTCHIFPSKSWDPETLPITKGTRQFDMLIAVDSSVDPDTPEMQVVLTHARSNRGRRTRAPVVRLVAINSIDHCALYFGKLYEKNSREYLENVTAAVVVLRDRVGALPPDLRPIYYQHLNYLLEWLENPLIPWPLPDVFPIQKYNSMDVERSLLSEVKFSSKRASIGNANFGESDDNDGGATNSRKRRRFRSPNEKTDALNTEDNASAPSFYETKRLKNDYSKNPTKQGMGQLTGIISSDQKMESDYHLSSNILTHKLIQNMGQLYVDILRQIKDIQMYFEMDSIEEGHITFYQEEDQKISHKLDDAKAVVADNVKKSDVLEQENKLYYTETENLEVEFASLLESLKARTPELKECTDLFEKSNSLNEEIEREQRISESKTLENEYMEREIKRADEAMQSAGEELVKVKESITSIELEIEASSNKFIAKQEDVKAGMARLNHQIEDRKETNTQFKKNLEDLTQKLQKVPISRARSSNQLASSATMTATSSSSNSTSNISSNRKIKNPA